MPELHEFWDPNEWEVHVYGLLQDRHGALNVVKVPARHVGDHGLDYYCLAEGAVFQCYAVQEPAETLERADKQKAKITADLKKLCSNSEELRRIFNTTMIKRWVLVVPTHDSAQVNAHLAAKTAEVRALNLPYIAVDFEATIHDHKSFLPASWSFRASQRQSVTIPSQPPSDQEIDDYVAASNPLVTSLTRKLRKRIGGDETLDEAVRESVGWFLERENALESLRTIAPQLHEQLSEVISRRTANLRLFGPPSDGTAYTILRTELDALVADLRAAVPNFSSSSANQIALGTIVDWLLRCPLDFPPYDHAS